MFSSALLINGFGYVARNQLSCDAFGCKIKKESEGNHVDRVGYDSQAKTQDAQYSYQDEYFFLAQILIDNWADEYSNYSSKVYESLSQLKFLIWATAIIIESGRNWRKLRFDKFAPLFFG